MPESASRGGSPNKSKKKIQKKSQKKSPKKIQKKSENFFLKKSKKKNQKKKIKKEIKKNQKKIGGVTPPPQDQTPPMTNYTLWDYVHPQD